MSIPILGANSKFKFHRIIYNTHYLFSITSARELLVGRIVLIGYNRKEAKDLPYPSPLSSLSVYIATLRFECSLDPQA